MSEWISMKEKTPRGACFVFCGDGREGYKGWIGEAFCIEGCFTHNNGTNNLYGVTHWMPLPEPPKDIA